MSDSLPLRDSEVIDVGRPPRRRRLRRWLIAALLLLLIVLSRGLSIYLSAAWFGSLGFSAVYWYIFKLKLALFLVFALVTLAILRTAFWFLERTFATKTMAKRTIVVNNQTIQFSPERFCVQVELLLRVAHPLHQLARDRALGQETEPGQALLEKIAQAFLETIPQIDDFSRKFRGVGHDQFRGRAGSRRPKIGHEIGDREIDLVADGADDRKRRMKNCASDDLFVEFPQVLDAAAATRDHNEIEWFPGLVRPPEFLDRDGDLSSGADSLDAHGIDEHMNIRRAAAEHIQNVADRGAARGSDDADPPRKFRQRTFPGGIEKTFPFQFPLERLEFRLEQTGAAGLQNLDVELVLAARFENRNVAVKLDLRAVRDRRRRRWQRVPKDHARDRRPLIFQREITMTGRLRPVIGNFSLDPNRAEPRLERAANLPSQFCDRENFRGLLKEIGSHDAE